MKTKFLFKSYTVLFCVLTILFTGCEDELDPVLVGIPDAQPHSSQAWPEGNTISALNNNVYLEFPHSAVETPVDIIVKECGVGGDCNFLLKMITIEPAMQFHMPVTVTLKYDGELVCNEESAETCDVVVCHWEREYDYLNRIDYMNRVNVECINCTINTNNKTISFYTMETGLFGLSVNNFNQ